jgi:dihydroorotate dehydrogenase/NAD-dependent dihydropyrimidine dehydrogenase PreA subunit
MKNDRLVTKLFDTLFDNPVFLGSGTLIEKYEQIDKYIQFGVGLVVPRTTRLIKDRPNNPSPCLYQNGENMLNAEWTGNDINYWRPYLEKLSKTHKVAMSVTGRDIKKCVTVMQEIDKYNFPFAEINISCAHSNFVNGRIKDNEEFIECLLKSMKDKGIKTPIALKLGHCDNLLNIAKIAKNNGVDALVLINTFGPIFDFNINNNFECERLLGMKSGMGGLSGKALFNIALTDVAIISKEIDIKVIACGGVGSAFDVIKMIMAGASAVEIYTASHILGNKSHLLFKKINDDLNKILKINKINNIHDLYKRAHKIINLDTNLKPLYPIINIKKCKHCGLCQSICLENAIEKKTNNTLKVNKNKCNGCGHCVSICPSKSVFF